MNSIATRSWIGFFGVIVSCVGWFGCEKRGTAPRDNNGKEKSQQAQAPRGDKPRPYEVRASCASFSPDGKTVLVGFGHEWVPPTSQKPVGWAVKLFDVQCGKELRTFNGHKGDVDFVAFFPDGKTAISAGRDEKFRVWDVDNGLEIKCFPGSVINERSVALLPDGKLLLCSASRNLQLWNPIEGQLLKEYEHSALSITVSPDGKLALLGGQLLDVGEGRVLRNFNSKKEGLGAPCAFSEDSKLALLTRWDLKARDGHPVLCDVSSMKVLKEFAGPFPLCYYFDSKGNKGILAGGNPSLFSLDLKTGKWLWSIKTVFTFEFFVFSTDGKLGLSAHGRQVVGNRLELVLWDTENGKKLRALEPNFPYLGYADNPVPDLNVPKPIKDP